jgi:hypothetical protein
MNCATSMLSTVIAGSCSGVMTKVCCLAPSNFRSHADTPWMRQPVRSAPVRSAWLRRADAFHHSWAMRIERTGEFEGRRSYLVMASPRPSVLGNWRASPYTARSRRAAIFTPSKTYGGKSAVGSAPSARGLPLQCIDLGSSSAMR